jgi:hypothetical protein
MLRNQIKNAMSKINLNYLIFNSRGKITTVVIPKKRSSCSEGAGLGDLNGTRNRGVVKTLEEQELGPYPDSPRILTSFIYLRM